MRLLYTSNPFYILSADLVFAGLRMSFGRGGPGAGSWALAGSLAGYTLLLATTACLLIRLGRLWDDLRTLLLVIVIMFLAIAMSGDDFLAADHARGALGSAVGLAFATSVSEVVLRAIRLRLPGWYRGAYHAMLALVFLYPVAMVPLLGDPDNPALQWALFGFGPAAALAVVLLVPAARGGSAALDKNGSPWRWPLYPWSLFVVLAGALCVRAWSLCVSFHYVEGSRSIFGPYFLVPIGLAAALVWLEIGLASRAPRASASACVLPLALVLLAAFGHRDEPVYAGFLARFMETFGGSPVYLSALAAVAFLAYAGFRGVRAGVELLPAGLIVLALVGPRTIAFDNLTWPRAVPMLAAAIVLGGIAWRRGDSRRAILAVGCLAIVGLRASSDLGAGPMAWPIAAHLGIAGLMTVGVLFDDPAARLARNSAAVALGLLGLFASDDGKGMWRSMPAGLMSWYAPVIAVAAASFGLLVRDRWYLAAAGAGLAGWIARSGSHGYARLREAIVGLDFVVFGLLFFAMAAAISLRKAGLWPRGGSRGYNPLVAAEPRNVETSQANHPGG
ncbi:MAG: hypothetical protein ACYC61_00545 [Isosphaeraceae bacterium]